MLMNLSDIKFPDYVTGIKGEDGYLAGGYDYQHMSPIGWARYWVINQLEEFVVGDYMITPTDPSYQQETDWIRIFTYPNGYYQAIKFVKYQPSGQSAGAGFITNFFDNNGTAIGQIPGVYNGYGSNATGIPADASILGLKLYIGANTVYYPTADPPDGTACGGFGFQIWTGWPDNGFDVTPPLYYWGQTQGRFLQITMATVENMESFEEYLHTHGKPFTGGIYTKDPLPKPPAGTDDPSGPGGGGGNYDDTSDPIDFPDPPTGGALECGAVVAHRVSKQTIEAIMSKLWSYDVSSLWQKAIEEPMDAIVSLHCLPFSPEVIADPNNILVGSIDTEVTAPKVTSQYKVIDCGTLNIEEYWGSALDYSPYTRAEIYLPFVGVKDLAIEDVMNSTLHIKYNIDVLTGDCIAFVKCGISVLYHFSGNCKMGVPLSSKSSNAFPNYMAGVGGIVSAAGAVATGGSSLLIAGATISAASAVAGSKVRTGRGSELTGANSLMDDFVPYIILHRPVQSLAKDYNKFKGYPSNITATLSSLSGYTEVEHVHLQNIPNATSAEMEEIKSLLKSGVIL